MLFIEIFLIQCYTLYLVFQFGLYLICRPICMMQFNQVYLIIIKILDVEWNNYQELLVRNTEIIIYEKLTDERESYHDFALSMFTYSITSYMCVLSGRSVGVSQVWAILMQWLDDIACVHVQQQRVHFCIVIVVCTSHMNKANCKQIVICIRMWHVDCEQEGKCITADVWVQIVIFDVWCNTNFIFILTAFCLAFTIVKKET